ncbi:MAG: hypothetical protein ACFBSE_25225 [Prochloraceae cyanobacterium]
MKRSLSILLATLGLCAFLESCAKISTEKQARELATTEENAPEYSINTAVEVEEIPEEPIDPLAKFDKVKSEHLTSNAKLLAGVKVEDNTNFANNIQQASYWLNHHNTLQNSWAKLEATQLSKVRRWSTAELAGIHQEVRDVFYPFSGPDFLYAYNLFPKAKKFVLVGLEPVGKLPDLTVNSGNNNNYKLQQARGSLYAILQWSFFRTNDMKVDMAKQGNLPVIALFMARTNNKILDVEYISLDGNGEVKKEGIGSIPGVKIDFVSAGEKEPKTLYYFSTDLSNHGLQQRPQLTKFVKQELNQPVTYLKAASYLMYYNSFSQIKNFILSESSKLLQDDSGMPLTSFDRNQWDLTFYGNYTQPISLFSNRYQPQLRRIYQSDRSIKPLDFGIGYKFQVNQSNLMLADLK